MTFETSVASPLTSRWRAAQYGSPNEYVDYAASKGALESFTIGLAQEVAADARVRTGH